jgi:ribonucleoside-triphosphate reductase
MVVQVLKRDGKTVQEFDLGKISRAIKGAFADVHGNEAAHLNIPAGRLALEVQSMIPEILTQDPEPNGTLVASVERIQDLVEIALMKEGFHSEAKAFILYREQRAKQRDQHPVSTEDAEAIKRNEIYFKDPTQVLQFLDKYARWDESKGRRETWEECVDRVISHFKWHVAAHYQDATISQSEWTELRDAMLYLEAFPAMRVMQMAGPAMQREPVAGYNCSATPIDSPYAFVELLYLSMNGVGAAFSVEREFVDQLPAVKKQKKAERIRHVIDDDTEGWSRAYQVGLDAWWNGFDVEFDPSKVRPAGARLKTKGGFASGPGPLLDLLMFARDVILARQGQRLRTIDCQRLACKTGKVAVLGGVRRAAMLSLSDPDDPDLRDCKRGQFWNTMPELGMANNSAAYEEKPTSIVFMKEWLALAESGSGERGIFNRSGYRKKKPKRRKNAKFLTNPCAEALLRARGLCNLSISVPRPGDTIETLKRKVRLAAIFGTLTSSMTHFGSILPDDWQKNAEEERLLGVDLLGAQDNDLLRFSRNPQFEKYRAARLEELKEEVIRANEEWAAKLGINPSVATTVIKPGGNSSELMNTGNAITGWFSPYFIRRYRMNSVNPLCKLSDRRRHPAPSGVRQQGPGQPRRVGLRVPQEGAGGGTDSRPALRDRPARELAAVHRALG